MEIAVVVIFVGLIASRAHPENSQFHHDRFGYNSRRCLAIWLQNIVYAVILFSIIITAVLVFFNDKDYLTPLTQTVFSKFPASKGKPKPAND